MTYEEAKREYDARISYQSGKYEGVRLENNTRLVKRSRNGCECYAIKLHRTDVVILFPDGLVRLDTGGWFTYTTKDRINKYAPGVGIVQSDFAWYINGGPKYGGISYQGASSDYGPEGRYTPFSSNKVYVRDGEPVQFDSDGNESPVRDLQPA